MDFAGIWSEFENAAQVCLSGNLEDVILMQHTDKESFESYEVCSE